jgi:hypothetical protein
MKPDMFRQPVSILVGLGFPTEVRGVMDAYRHLVEWPVSLRDAAHSIALKACIAELRGEIEADTARGLFAALPRNTICWHRTPVRSPPHAYGVIGIHMCDEMVR